MASAKKSVERFLLNYNRSVLGSFFTRIELKKIDEKIFPDRDDLSLASLSAMISAIIQGSKLKLRKYLIVTIGERDRETFFP